MPTRRFIVASIVALGLGAVALAYRYFFGMDWVAALLWTLTSLAVTVACGFRYRDEWLAHEVRMVESAAYREQFKANVRIAKWGLVICVASLAFFGLSMVFTPDEILAFYAFAVTFCIGFVMMWMPIMTMFFGMYRR